MSRTRFEQIISILHISNNAIQPTRDSVKYDRLYKVKAFQCLLISYL